MHISKETTLQSENPYWKMSIVYLLQDPRARLADMKASTRFRNKAGVLKTFTKKSYQVVIPNLCAELLQAVEYLAGNARIAAGMRIHSLRHEDVLLDMDQEVGCVHDEDVHCFIITIGQTNPEVP